MGAVDTTYTFTATDTITSTKMNNIIDQTTMTSDAVVGTTLEVSGGKLRIKSGGITSNEMGTDSVTTNSVVNSSITTAKIADLNVTTAKIENSSVTQAKLSANIAGNGPAFFVYASAGTTVPSSTTTKVNLGGETFDTNAEFSSGRFTPTVAGYYFLSGAVQMTTSSSDLWCILGKNGGFSIYGSKVEGVSSSNANASGLVYLNGSTDYVEMFVRHISGTNRTVDNSAQGTFFCGFLARAA